MSGLINLRRTALMAGLVTQHWSMDMVDLGAVAAVLSVPTALVAAWWTKRSAESATSAALLAGRIQADTAISAVQTQSLLQWDQQRHIALDSACMEFLSVSDTLVGVVKRLPSLDHDERPGLVAKHAIPVEARYASLELLAPHDVLAAAEFLLSQCRLLERCALDRAVLRAPISSLEAGWCPGDPEECTDDRHGSAYVPGNFSSGGRARTSSKEGVTGIFWTTASAAAPPHRNASGSGSLPGRPLPGHVGATDRWMGPGPAHRTPRIPP